MKIRKPTLADSLPKKGNKKDGKKKPNIDGLAEDYLKEKSIIKEHNAEADAIKEQIEAQVNLHGVEDGKRKMVTGKKYVCGVTRVDPRPYLDPALIKKHIKDKAILKKLITIRTDEIVEESRFVLMVESGVLPRSIVKKVTVSPPSTSSRFFCEPIENKPESQ